MAAQPNRRPNARGNQRPPVDFGETAAPIPPTPSQLPHPAFLAPEMGANLRGVADGRPICWIDAAHDRLATLWSRSRRGRGSKHPSEINLRDKVQNGRRDEAPVLVEIHIPQCLLGATHMRKRHPQLYQSPLHTRPTRANRRPLMSSDALPSDIEIVGRLG